MKRFPDPIVLPAEVRKARKDRISKLIRSSTKGISIRLSISFIELLAVLFVGSSALFMDALSTAVDIAASLFLILCFKLADKPPDENHPFGHGRYEPLAGLQLALFLFFLGFGMFVYQISGVARPENRVINAYLWFIPFIATILLEGCYQFLMRTARKQNSPALASEAWHYRIDSLSSFFATLALLLAAFFPAFSVTIDHLGAAVIACVMMVVGITTAKSNLNQLMDRVPDATFFNKVKMAPFKVPGVLGTEKTRIQMYGPDAHVDIDIEVDPLLSVEDAHTISQKARAEIQKAWPAVECDGAYRTILSWRSLMLYSLCDRFCGTLGAVALSQIPQYFQQYLHLLSGHVAELSYQVDLLQRSAQMSGKTLPELIQKFLNSVDPDFSAQGLVMKGTLERYNDLNTALSAFRDSSLLSRPLLLLKHFNWQISKETLGQFEPGFAFTAEGVLYAVLGLLLGTCTFRFFAYLVGRKMKRFRASS